MRRVQWMVLLALVCGVGAGCNRKQVQTPPPKDPEVRVALPVYREVIDYEDFTGRTESPEYVTLKARVTGYLDNANFKEGDDVKKGQVLFKIDPRPYRAELNRADANLFQSEARFKRLEADYQRADRQRGASGAISAQEFDKAAGDLKEAREAVRVSKAALAIAKLNLDFTDVRAPFGGRVSRRFMDPGNLVKADDTSLTTIVSLDKMYVNFDVDERTMLTIRRKIGTGEVESYRNVKDLPIRMGLADEIDRVTNVARYPHEGVLNFVDNRIDESTGTIRVRAIFDNNRLKNKNYLLSPGQFVRIRLPIGRPYRALLIAERAVGTDQGQKFVYVVNDKNEIEYRQIHVGPVHEGLRVVLKPTREREKRIGRNDRIVVSGLQRVRPGIKVVPTKVDMKTGEPLSWLNLWKYVDLHGPSRSKKSSK